MAAYIVARCALPPRVVADLTGELELRLRLVTAGSSAAAGRCTVQWWGQREDTEIALETTPISAAEHLWTTVVFPLRAGPQLIAAYLRDSKTIKVTVSILGQPVFPDCIISLDSLAADVFTMPAKSSSTSFCDGENALTDGIALQYQVSARFGAAALLRLPGVQKDALSIDASGAVASRGVMPSLDLYAAATTRLGGNAADGTIAFRGDDQLMTSFEINEIVAAHDVTGVLPTLRSALLRPVLVHGAESPQSPRAVGPGLQLRNRDIRSVRTGESSREARITEPQLSRWAAPSVFDGTAPGAVAVDVTAQRSVPRPLTREEPPASLQLSTSFSREEPPVSMGPVLSAVVVQPVQIKAVSLRQPRQLAPLGDGADDVVHHAAGSAAAVERGPPVDLVERGPPVDLVERGPPVDLVERGPPVDLVERGPPVDLAALLERVHQGVRTVTDCLGDDGTMHVTQTAYPRLSRWKQMQDPLAVRPNSSDDDLPGGSEGPAAVQAGIEAAAIGSSVGDGTGSAAQSCDMWLEFLASQDYVPLTEAVAMVTRDSSMRGVDDLSERTVAPAGLEPIASTNNNDVDYITAIMEQAREYKDADDLSAGASPSLTAVSAALASVAMSAVSLTVSVPRLQVFPAAAVAAAHDETGSFAGLALLAAGASATSGGVPTAAPKGQKPPTRQASSQSIGRMLPVRAVNRNSAFALRDWLRDECRIVVEYSIVADGSVPSAPARSLAGVVIASCSASQTGQSALAQPKHSAPTLTKEPVPQRAGQRLTPAVVTGAAGPRRSQQRSEAPLRGTAAPPSTQANGSAALPLGLVADRDVPVIFELAHCRSVSVAPSLSAVHGATPETDRDSARLCADDLMVAFVRFAVYIDVSVGPPSMPAAPAGTNITRVKSSVAVGPAPVERKQVFIGAAKVPLLQLVASQDRTTSRDLRLQGTLDIVYSRRRQRWVIRSKQTKASTDKLAGALYPARDGSIGITVNEEACLSRQQAALASIAGLDEQIRHRVTNILKLRTERTLAEVDSSKSSLAVPPGPAVDEEAEVVGQLDFVFSLGLATPSAPDEPATENYVGLHTSPVLPREQLFTPLRSSVFHLRTSSVLSVPAINPSRPESHISPVLIVPAPVPALLDRWDASAFRLAAKGTRESLPVVRACGLLSKRRLHGTLADLPPGLSIAVRILATSPVNIAVESVTQRDQLLCLLSAAVWRTGGSTEGTISLLRATVAATIKEPRLRQRLSSLGNGGSMSSSMRITHWHDSFADVISAGGADSWRIVLEAAHAAPLTAILRAIMTVSSSTGTAAHSDTVLDIPGFVASQHSSLITAIRDLCRSPVSQIDDLSDTPVLIHVASFLHAACVDAAALLEAHSSLCALLVGVLFQTSKISGSLPSRIAGTSDASCGASSFAVLSRRWSNSDAAIWQTRSNRDLEDASLALLSPTVIVSLDRLVKAEADTFFVRCLAPSSLLPLITSILPLSTVSGRGPTSATFSLRVSTCTTSSDAQEVAASLIASSFAFELHRSVRAKDASSPGTCDSSRSSTLLGVAFIPSFPLIRSIVGLLSDFWATFDGTAANVPAVNDVLKHSVVTFADPVTAAPVSTARISLSVCIGSRALVFLARYTAARVITGWWRALLKSRQSAEVALVTQQYPAAAIITIAPVGIANTNVVSASSATLLSDVQPAVNVNVAAVDNDSVRSVIGWLHTFAFSLLGSAPLLAGSSLVSVSYEFPCDPDHSASAASNFELHWPGAACNEGRSTQTHEFVLPDASSWVENKDAVIDFLPNGTLGMPFNTADVTNTAAYEDVAVGGLLLHAVAETRDDVGVSALPKPLLCDIVDAAWDSCSHTSCSHAATIRASRVLEVPLFSKVCAGSPPYLVLNVGVSYSAAPVWAFNRSEARAPREANSSGTGNSLVVENIVSAAQVGGCQPVCVTDFPGLGGGASVHDRDSILLEGALPSVQPITVRMTTSVALETAEMIAVSPPATVAAATPPALGSHESSAVVTNKPASFLHVHAEPQIVQASPSLVFLRLRISRASQIPLASIQRVAPSDSRECARGVSLYAVVNWPFVPGVCISQTGNYQLLTEPRVVTTWKRCSCTGGDCPHEPCASAEWGWEGGIWLPSSPFYWSAVTGRCVREGGMAHAPSETLAGGLPALRRSLGPPPAPGVGNPLTLSATIDVYVACAFGGTATARPWLDAVLATASINLRDIVATSHGTLGVYELRPPPSASEMLETSHFGHISVSLRVCEGGDGDVGGAVSEEQGRGLRCEPSPTESASALIAGAPANMALGRGDVLRYISRMLQPDTLATCDGPDTAADVDQIQCNAGPSPSQASSYEQNLTDELLLPIPSHISGPSSDAAPLVSSSDNANAVNTNGDVDFNAVSAALHSPMRVSTVEISTDDDEPLSGMAPGGGVPTPIALELLPPDDVDAGGNADRHPSPLDALRVSASSSSPLENLYERGSSLLGAEGALTPSPTHENLLPAQPSPDTDDLVDAFQRSRQWGNDSSDFGAQHDDGRTRVVNVDAEDFDTDAEILVVHPRTIGGSCSGSPDAASIASSVRSVTHSRGDSASGGECAIDQVPSHRDVVLPPTCAADDTVSLTTEMPQKDEMAPRAHSPEAHAEVDSPEAHAEVDSPEAHADADSPEAHADADSPEAHVDADSPEAHADADSPEAHADAGIFPQHDMGVDSTIATASQPNPGVESVLRQLHISPVSPHQSAVLVPVQALPLTSRLGLLLQRQLEMAPPSLRAPSPSFAPEVPLRAVTTSAPVIVPAAVDRLQFLRDLLHGDGSITPGVVAARVAPVLSCPSDVPRQCTGAVAAAEPLRDSLESMSRLLDARTNAIARALRSR